MMDELEKIVGINIIRALNDYPVEKPNFDFKAEWPHLSSKDAHYYKFLRNICAFANSVKGHEGYIVFGFDEKSKKFTNTKFEATGLRDSSDLYNLIVKNIVEPFNVRIENIKYESNILSVLIIPISLSKPHVLKQYRTFSKNGQISIYENYIPVRTESITRSATKYDLDEMYYDRKNILLEKRILLSVLTIGLSKSPLGDKVRVILIVENIGIRPVTLIDFQLEVDAPELEDNTIRVFSFRETEGNQAYKSGDTTIIMTSNVTKSLTLYFNQKEEIDIVGLLADRKRKHVIVAKTINGDYIREPLNYLYYRDKGNSDYLAV